MATAARFWYLPPQVSCLHVRATRPLGDGRFVMETPFGEATYRVDADPQRLVADFVLDTPNGESVLPTRVIHHARGSVFSFTITRAPGISDGDWERGRRGLDEELETLKRPPRSRVTAGRHVPTKRGHIRRARSSSGRRRLRALRDRSSNRHAPARMIWHG